MNLDPNAFQAMASFSNCSPSQWGLRALEAEGQVGSGPRISPKTGVERRIDPNRRKKFSLPESELLGKAGQKGSRMARLVVKPRQDSHPRIISTLRGHSSKSRTGVQGSQEQSQLPSLSVRWQLGQSPSRPTPAPSGLPA